MLRVPCAARRSRLALIADEVGEAAVAAAVRQRLAGLLEGWYTGSGQDVLQQAPNVETGPWREGIARTS